MTDNVENLILEHLRVMRASIDRVGEAVNDLKLRVGQIEEHLAGMRRDMSMLHADIAITHKRLGGLEGRVERIEKRLELVG
jgi:chromosome segregation ATPase